MYPPRWLWRQYNSTNLQTLREFLFKHSLFQNSPFWKSLCLDYELLTTVIQCISKSLVLRMFYTELRNFEIGRTVNTTSKSRSVTPGQLVNQIQVRILSVRQPGTTSISTRSRKAFHPKRSSTIFFKKIEKFLANCLVCRNVFATSDLLGSPQLNGQVGQYTWTPKPQLYYPLNLETTIYYSPKTHSHDLTSLFQ